MTVVSQFGHDMSGPTANIPTNAEPGMTYFDTTRNLLLVANSSGVMVSATLKPPVALSGSADAIPPHTTAEYIVTKAGVDAMTLVAPTVGTDDGLVVTISSVTAFAHTITTAGLFLTGTASINVATFAAQKGASLTLRAYQGKWIVVSENQITFS